MLVPHDWIFIQQLKHTTSKDAFKEFLITMWPINGNEQTIISTISTKEIHFIWMRKMKRKDEDEKIVRQKIWSISVNSLQKMNLSFFSEI